MSQGFEMNDDVLVGYSGAASEIIIPDGIVTIGNRAFKGNKKIVTVIMPDTVTTIKSDAFGGCTKLQKIVFSKNITDINYGAFSGCIKLEEVILPDSLRRMERGVFSGCKKLVKVVCNAPHFTPVFSPFGSQFEEPVGIIDEKGFIIFARTLFGYRGNEKEIVIPEGVERIGKGTFQSSLYSWGERYDIETVICPKSLTYIGKQAFEHCKNLKKIDIPSGVTIEEGAFSGCDGLVDENGFFIYGGKALHYCGKDNIVNVPAGVKVLSPELFSCENETNPGNKNIHTINFPEGLEEIGEKAFFASDLLEKIVIPTSVKKIGDAAFAQCSHLSSVTLLGSNIEMGTGVFTGCRCMADRDGFVIQNHVLYIYYVTDKEIVIPEGVTSIAPNAFKKTEITSVSFPSTLGLIGSGGFYCCEMLQEMIIPEGITEIGKLTFKGCSGLRKIVLPATVKEIGYGAFAGCKALESITLPEGIKAIEDAAFSECQKLKNINIPESVEEIGDQAFEHCSSLTEVDLKEGLRTIGWGAFQYCEKMTEIYLPDTIETVGYAAFYYCISLRKIHYKGGKKCMNRHAFPECPGLIDKNGMIIIGDTLWEYHGTEDHVVVPEGVVSIGDEALSNRIGFLGKSRNMVPMKSIVFPSGLKEIGKKAFVGCSLLENMELPTGMERIEEEAFRGCVSLESIILPDTVTYIGAAAFYNCEKLRKIKLPEELKSIEDCTFGGCKEIESICIPGNVQRIGKQVFQGCRSLEEFKVNEENNDYAVQEGVLINKEGNTLIWYPGGKKEEEYKIPEKITIIKSHAFMDALNLKSIEIPSNVTNLEDEIFPRYTIWEQFKFEKIKVSPQAGSLSIGSEVFHFEDNKESLLYPELPLSFVKEQALQIRLALGYCLNPDKYQGEYEEMYKKYAQSHKKTLLKRAEALKLSKVKEYYGEDGAADKKSKNTSDMNYKKLSAQAKVQLLEKVVLEGDVEQVKTIMAGCKKFEFTARALGFACLYSTLEMVKALVNGGATFHYSYSTVLKRKYGVAYTRKSETYPAEYALMVAKTNVNVYVPMVFTDTYELHFGTQPQIELPENSEAVRADIAEFLLSMPDACFDAPQVLFYAIMWGCTEVAERLMQKGVELGELYGSFLAFNDARWERNELLSTLVQLSPEKILFALKSYNDCLKKNNEELMLNQRVFESGESSFLDAEVLKYLFEETYTGKITKSKVMEMIIDQEDLRALEVAVSVGMVKTPAQRENAIKYAADKKKNEVLAWLLDYKNRTVDLAAEEAEEEAKMLKELMEDPNSVSALKKKWGYEKLKDGTLQITSYKGAEVEVEVPAKIGKAQVTVIRYGAFACDSFARNKNRKYITKVIIPEGIKRIEVGAFAECEALETIILPSTLKSIEDSAFRRCKKLSKIDMPQLEKNGLGIFEECDALQNSDGMIIVNGVLYNYANCKEEKNIVHIPEGVTKIADNVFARRWGSISLEYIIKEIVIPEGVKEIGENAFRGLTHLKKVTIPSTVQRIKKNAFKGCGLEEVLFTEGLREIGESAFEETEIDQLRIPSTVTAIGSRAFYGCSKLRDLYISAEAKNLGENLLGDPDSYARDTWGYYKPSGIYVHTPTGSAAAKYMEQYGGVYVTNNDPKE